MNLSPHFTLEELTVSQEATRSGLRNAPNEVQTESLRQLCINILEPLRTRLKRPIVINSGFRSTSINRRIGGADKSQHCKGEAVDFIVPGVSIADVIEIIKKLGLPVDQCINEHGAWVHCSYRKSGNRGEYLKARRQGGKTVYQPL